MADTFMRSGLNIETLKTARKYFGGAENTRCGPTAQLYSELEEGGLPPNAVRLIVLPVADAPEISSFGVPSFRAPPLPSCAAKLAACMFNYVAGITSTSFVCAMSGSVRLFRGALHHAKR